MCIVDLFVALVFKLFLLVWPVFEETFSDCNFFLKAGGHKKAKLNLISNQALVFLQYISPKC